MRSFTRIILPGVPNAGWVRDGQILRMGWPESPQAYHSLVDVGIKRRINLRTAHSDENECRAAGIEYIHCPIIALAPPALEMFKPLINLIQPGDAIGCALGSDRTGLTILLERIWVEGWAKDDALVEFAAYANPQLRLEMWPGIHERIEEV